MNRVQRIGLVSVLTLALAGLALAGADRGAMDLTSGDQVYACSCGEACPCQTLSNNPGKCSCGKDMAQASVVRAGDGTAMLKAEGWEKERPFKTVGKYTCSCPPACPCDTVSQIPGNCTCGKEMKKVEG